MENVSEAEIPSTKEEELILPKMVQLPNIFRIISIFVAVIVIFFALHFKDIVLKTKTKLISSVPLPSPSATPVYEQKSETPQVGQHVFTTRLAFSTDEGKLKMPNFRDTRGIFPYNDHYIVAGIHQLSEYDPKDKRYVRINDPNTLPCIQSAAKIGQYLYIACGSGITLLTDGSVRGVSTLAKIDLDTGLVLKTYFNDKDPRINLWLASQNGFLWMSSWSGVTRIDTLNNDEAVNFTIDDLGYPNCFANRIYQKNGKIAVFISGSDGCKGGTAFYHEETKTWTKEKTSYNPVAEVNQVPRISGEPLPTFYASTPKGADETYFFSDAGIYSAKNDSLPNMYVPFSKSIYQKLIPEYLDVELSSMYVTSDESYAVFFNRVAGGFGEAYWDTLTVKNRMIMLLIDMKNGQVYDLLSRLSRVPTKSEETLILRMTGQSTMNFNEDDGALVLSSGEDQSVFGTIDLQKRIFIFAK